MHRLVRELGEEKCIEKYDHRQRDQVYPYPALQSLSVVVARAVTARTALILIISHEYSPVLYFI